MKNKIILLPTFLLLNSCASLNDSMLLGATFGGMTGIAATSAAYNKTGNNATSEDLVSSASLGIALGLLTSYLIHTDVKEKRGDAYLNSPEIYFGDLPPSPFIMTPASKKKGGK